MRKDIAGAGPESTTPVFEVLERKVREQAQAFIQQILEEEVTELLGRGKSERREEVDAPAGYRNGYGKPRRLSLSCGTEADDEFGDDHPPPSPSEESGRAI